MMKTDAFGPTPLADSWGPEGLGGACVRLGFASSGQVEECLRLQAEAIRRGESAPRLGELLVERGYATADQVARALALQGQAILACRRCEIRFNVPLGGDGPREGDDQPGRKRPKFRANTKFFVRLADHPRATRLRFVDRATGDIELFLWPPDAAGKLRRPGADGGVPADGGSSDSPAPADGGPPRDGGSKDGGAGAARDGGKHDPVEP